jgi:hypothetical protein
MLSVSHLSISGRHWFTIHLEPVSPFYVLSHSFNKSLVRDILPELMGQIIFLVSSTEFEQQEVRIIIFSA